MLLMLTFLHFVIIGYCFEDKEIEIVSSLIQSLFVKRCMLITTLQNESNQVSSAIKFLSEKLISTVSFDLFESDKNIIKSNSLQMKSVVIFKVKNDYELLKCIKIIQLQIYLNKDFANFIWILLLEHNSSKIAIEIPVPFDCQLLIIKKNKKGYDITELYQRKPSSKVIRKKFGQYNCVRGLIVDEKIKNRRKNLDGEIMISRIYSVRLICNWPAPCIHYYLWQDLGHILNFSILLIEADQMKTNTTIKADIALDAISFFHAKQTNLPYVIGPILRAHFYIRDLGKDTSSWKIYLEPFEQKLWKVLLYWLLISSSTFIAISWIASKTFNIKKPTLLHEGLTPYDSLCNQDTNISYLTSLRIAKIAVFIVSGVIVPAFCGSVVSYLTAEKSKIPFTDLETFVKDGTYKLALIRVDFLMSYFNATNDPIVKTVREKHFIDADQFPQFHEKSIDMICSIPKLAFINFNYQMMQYLSPCKIRRIHKEFMTLPSAMMLQNDGTQYRKLVLDMLIQFRSVGVIAKEEKILYGRTHFHSREECQPIELDTVKSLFVVLSIGILGSLIFFVVEMIYYKFKKSIK